MNYTMHIQGGLGDLFCYMLSPDPVWRNHPLRALSTIIQREECLNLHIYSDNPDSANLFDKYCVVYRHKHHEYTKFFSDVPEEMCTDNKMSFIDTSNPIKLPILFIHPFTTTPNKKWLVSPEKTSLLEEVIERAKKKGYVVVLYGKDTPELYFGKDTPFSCEERFDYKTEGLYNLTDFRIDIEYVLKYIAYSSVMLCIDSAFMMARWLNPKMKVISLFPDSYSKNKDIFDHYYYQGLDKGNNEFLYYSQATAEAIDQLIPNLKE